MNYYTLSWGEYKCSTIQARSEAEARQAWVDGLDDAVKVEIYDAEFIEIYRSNEKGEAL
jgi:hypothetical protein